MNPYVATGIAMCAIVGVALAATAWMAVMFTQRAKRDLTAAFTPLAEAVDGTFDLDEAIVAGHYRGHIVEGRMANASEGPGRVFRTELVDPAGGTAWRLTMVPSKQPDKAPTPYFESKDPEMQAKLGPCWEDSLREVADLPRERVRVDYDPGPGRLRLIRAMRTRRDIPDVAAFRRQLDFLAELGDVNRQAQGAPE